MRLSRLGSGWEPLIGQVAAAIAPALGAPPADVLARYLDLVVEWNARIDLTAARGPGELVDLFVADALVLATHARAEQWVDVGSGAGAPGLPLALIAPELRVTLVEPRSKRVAFLRSALGTLARTDVQVTRARCDELEDASFDHAVARATLPPDEWLREGARIARRGVWVLIARDEPPSLAGWRADADVHYRWPLTGVERRALRYVPVET